MTALLKSHKKEGFIDKVYCYNMIYHYICDMKTRVLEICKQRGTSLGELAEKIGVSQSNLSASLKKNPTLNTLQAVANNLNVELAELFEQPQRRLYGYLEVDGVVKKISGPIDLLPIVGTFGITSYSNFKVCKKDLRDFIRKRIDNMNEAASFAAILNGATLVNVAYSPENGYGKFILSEYTDGKEVYTCVYDLFEYLNPDDKIAEDDLISFMWSEIIGFIDAKREWTDKELEDLGVY